MLSLWYTRTIGDDDQEFLMHRQVRKAAEAISILHYPHYPTVETFTSWSEIQSALDAATAEPQVFIYILAFGALNAKKAGELRVGSLLLNRGALEALVAKPNVHVHLVCDPTLDMAKLPTEKAIDDNMSVIGCAPTLHQRAPTLTIAAVVKASKQISVPPSNAPPLEEDAPCENEDEDAPDPRSYYSPKMPRFTEIYFRCLVDTVSSNADFGTSVNRGLEGAYVAAVQLRLRYQPEVMQLLLRPSPESTASTAGIPHLSDDAKRGICRGYTYLSPNPSVSTQHEEDAQPLSQSTTVSGRQEVVTQAAPSDAKALPPATRGVGLNPQATSFQPKAATVPGHGQTVAVPPPIARPVLPVTSHSAPAPGVGPPHDNPQLLSVQLNDHTPFRPAGASHPLIARAALSSASMGPLSYATDSTLSLGTSTLSSTVAANPLGTRAASSGAGGTPTLAKPVLEHSGESGSSGSQSIKGASQVASKELARRFKAGPKGMVLHIGPFASPSMDGGRKVCPVCTMTIPEDVTWTDHVLTERHLQAVGDPLPHAQYYCYICSAIVSGDKNLTLHVEGTRHRRKVEIGTRCGCDGCEMLLFTDPDLLSHKALCHSK